MWAEEDHDMQLTDDERRQVTYDLTNTNTSSNYSTPHQKWFILPAAATIASFGGIIFGYDIGIISGALLQLRCEFLLTCHEQEVIVATLVIGALISSLCGGYLLDKCGRKVTIIINAFIFIGGAAILAAANSFGMFIIGRFVVGFSVSLSAIADCIYISEIASFKWRGLLVSMNEMGITIGILISYLMNYLFVQVPDGWRYMFALSALPALLQLVGMFFLPESPRWLVNKEKDNKAIEIIKMLWPYVDPTQELDRLKNSVSSEKDYSLFHLFTNRENLRMRMFIGCGLVLFQQLSGQPSVLYYAPVLLQNLGYNSNDSATLATVGLGVMKVVFTFITLSTVDKLGRRTFLLLGATVMTISLITLSGLTVSFIDYSNNRCHELVGMNKLHSHLLQAEDNCNILQNSSVLCDIQNELINSSVFSNCSVSNNTVNIHNDIPSSVKYTSLIALMLFVIGYSIGYGPMSWLLLSEIFPTGIKGRAIGLVSSVNWGANMLLSVTFLDMITMIGPFGIFLIYAMIGVLSIFFICQFVPETRGKSLEMISVELSQTLDLPCHPQNCCMNAENLMVGDEEWQLLVNNNCDGREHYETTQPL